MKYKILNLYCGIGGNRKLWGDEYDITAVEYNPEIAAIYQDLFPNDTVIVGDAHEYLLRNFKDFDFIWASPPCPTHSRARFWGHQNNPIYPDFSLYEEITFLRKWYKGKWIIENVIPYYEPIIKPDIILHRHLVWCNFSIKHKDFEKLETCQKKKEKDFLEQKFGFDLSKFTGIDKRKVLRNCVVPEMGAYILNSAFDKKEFITPSVSSALLFDFA
jgi:DNA (cytosine-5)-methyltransferase 1